MTHIGLVASVEQAPAVIEAETWVNQVLFLSAVFRSQPRS